MSGNININSVVASQAATIISNRAVGFVGKNLDPEDNVSTISANQKGKETYRDSQNTFVRFGNALAVDAGNINSLNIEYKEYDAMLSQIIKMKFSK